MTDEQINRAIAKMCGWEILENPIIIGCACYAKDPHGEPECGVPNYSGDLNAMHEAEKVLRNGRNYEYLHQLERVTQSSMIYATAHQRAEAFLRTLGKWKEGE